MPPLGIHAASFLLYLARERRYSPHTVQAYRRTLELAREQFGGAPWNDIERDDVRGFVRQMDLVYSPATVSQRISALRSFYRFLVRSGEVERNPVKGIRGPRVDRKLPRPLTVGQMEDVFDRLEARVRDGGRNARRNLSLMEVAYSAGLRVSELAGLERVDLRFDRREARVMGKGRKERVVPLGGSALEATERYLDTRPDGSGPLWISERGGGVSVRQVQRLATGALRAVDGVEDASAHTIRHSTATHMIDGGASLPTVAVLLGHESIRTTRRYVRVSVERLKRVHRACHPRGG